MLNEYNGIGLVRGGRALTRPFMAFEVFCFGEAAATNGTLAQDHACSVVGGDRKCPAKTSKSGMWERWKCVLRRQEDEDKTEKKDQGQRFWTFSPEYGSNRMKCLFSRGESSNKRQQQAGTERTDG